MFGDDPARAERERLVKMLEAGGYDQQEMGNYYEQAAAPVEEGMANASKSSAATYGRRGLSGSGLQTGAQNDIAVRRAAQLRQAKLGAIQQATTARRQRLLDALGGYGGLSQENQGQFADVMGAGGMGAAAGAGWKANKDMQERMSNLDAQNAAFQQAYLARLGGGGGYMAPTVPDYQLSLGVK
jgi:hypothetical protein